MTMVVADGDVESSGSVLASTSVLSYQPSLSLSGFLGSVLKMVVSPTSVSPSRSESSMGPSGRKRRALALRRAHLILQRTVFRGRVWR